MMTTQYEVVRAKAYWHTSKRRTANAAKSALPYASIAGGVDTPGPMPNPAVKPREAASSRPKAQNICRAFFGVFEHTPSKPSAACFTLSDANLQPHASPSPMVLRRVFVG